MNYVTPAIAKETLNVSLATLRRWANAGKIKHFRTPGGQFRYDLTSVGVSVPVSVPVSVATSARHRAHLGDGLVPVSAPSRHRLDADLGTVSMPVSVAAPVPVSVPVSANPRRIAVEPPSAAKPMPQAPIQPRLDPAALRRAVEGLARASAV